MARTVTLFYKTLNQYLTARL